MQVQNALFPTSDNRLLSLPVLKILCHFDL